MKIKKIAQGIKRIVQSTKQIISKINYSRLSKRVALSILGLAFAISVTTTSVWMWRHFSQPQNHYAALISCGETLYDDKIIHSEYWTDLLMTYKTLIDQGYTHENIYVFYGKGPNTDFNSKYDYYNIHSSNYSNFPDSTIVDYSNEWSELKKGFEDLAYKVTKKDKLEIHWIIGHGGINRSSPYSYFGNSYSNFLDKSTADSYKVYFEHWKDSTKIKPNISIEKKEVLNLINSIKDYKQREIYWLTCHSGAMIVGSEQLGGPRTTVIVSSPWNKTSYSRSKNGYYSGEFNWISYGIRNNQYFSGDSIKLYKSDIKWSITPYKLYRQLKYSNHIRSDVAMGGQSPIAIYVSIKEKMIDFPGKVCDTIDKAEHEVEQFVIKNWFMFILELQVILLYFWFIRRKQQMIKK